MTKDKIKKYNGIMLPLLSGFMMAAAFQYAALFWLGWIALIPLFYCFCARGGHGAIKMLSLFAAAFYLPLVSFIFALHPLDYMGFSNGASLALLSLGWLLLAAWETGGFALMGLINRWLNKRQKQALAGKNLALLCSLWLILEWLQGLSPLGFTWGRLAVAQAACPALIQSAALGGSLLVSALVLAVNALLTGALYRRDKRWLLIALALFALNWGGGALRLALPPAETPEQVRIGVVQGTLPSQLKWQGDLEAQNRRQFYQQSLQAAEQGAQLILWPETCLAETLLKGQVPANTLYRQVAAEGGAELLAGALWQEQPGITYNALIQASAERAEAVYGKRHLVPFGEYLPWSGVIGTLLPGLTAVSGVTPYTGDGLVVAAGSRFGAMICYESIFAPLARTSVAEGAQALLMVTNDSWFWGTAAMRQHYYQAQLRAVEQNRWLLRAANAGFSGVIDNYGRSLEEIAPQDSGYLLADTPLLSRHSLYYYVGEWVLVAALALILRQLWRIMRA